MPGSHTARTIVTMRSAATLPSRAETPRNDVGVVPEETVAAKFEEKPPVPPVAVTASVVPDAQAHVVPPAVSPAVPAAATIPEVKAEVKTEVKPEAKTEDKKNPFAIKREHKTAINDFWVSLNRQSLASASLS